MQTVHGSPQPLALLALAPHPDDAEIGCGGTLIKAALAGQAVGVLELTLGELGTKGTPEVRLEEARTAAGIMGLAFRGNLGLPDGGIGQGEDHAFRLARALRVLRPRTLLLPHPDDRHPDHTATYHLGKRAAHLAGLVKAPLGSDARDRLGSDARDRLGSDARDRLGSDARDRLEGEVHKTLRLYRYQGNFPMEASVLVDVEGALEVWERAVMAHASQFSGPAVSETVSPDVLERRRARMMYWGTFVGVRHAEAFSSELPLLLEGL